MIRGGSWNNAASNCRSAYRNNNDPSTRNNNVGFRLVSTMPRKDKQGPIRLGPRPAEAGTNTPGPGRPVAAPLSAAGQKPRRGLFRRVEFSRGERKAF